MISTRIRVVSPDKTERPVTKSLGLPGTRGTNLISPPLTPYNGGKPQYPLFSPNRPITARLGVQVLLGEFPEYQSGYSRVQENREYNVEEEVNPMNNRFSINSALSKIPNLSPQHQELVANLVEEFAKLDGVETSASTSQSEPLDRYILAWQNSLSHFAPRTRELYQYYVERLLANVPPPITTIAIEGYLASLQEKVSPNALKNELKAAKSFFAFLYDRDIIASDLAAKIHHPKIVKKETVCPCDDEVAKFLAVLPEVKNPRAKLMIFLFINTGIRFTEMVTLTWGKVNLERCQITILGKGSKWRTIPISPQVRDFLAELRNGHDDNEMLFPTQSKKGRWDNSDANKMIARLCRRAGLKRYTCHQFRHYFATHTLKAGGKKTLKSLQEMLGHERAATTLDFYIHTDEEEIRKTHEAFAPLSGGKELMPKKHKKGRGSNHGQTN